MSKGSAGVDEFGGYQKAWLKKSDVDIEDDETMDSISSLIGIDIEQKAMELLFDQ